MIGTRMNTAVTSDITRAISRPSKRSRTSAMVIVRGPATPIPCRSRPASIIGKLCDSSASEQPDREDRQAQEGRRLSSRGVGERPVEELPDPEPEEQQRHYELVVVRARDAERGADGGQRRQHHVDRERHECRQHGHERHELGSAF